jgi:hypothetical protein
LAGQRASAAYTEVGPHREALEFSLPIANDAAVKTL